jgi:hypothetical protein
MKIKGLNIKLLVWSVVRKEFDYPIEDDNEGFEFGFEFIVNEDEEKPDTQWFRSESDMFTFINSNELKEIVVVL